MTATVRNTLLCLMLCSLAWIAGCGGSSSTALGISTSSVPNGNLNTPYNSTLQASGGTGPYTWSVSAGALPAGLTLDPNTGTIGGVATTTGKATFTAKVTDAASPAATATVSLSMTIISMSITTTTLPNATNGTAYTATLSATGGTTPYSWSVSSGALPTGLTLASGTGVISGTPTASGVSTFTAQVSDAESPAVTATQSLTISTSLPSLAQVPLANGLVGTAYTQTLQATGGVAPLTWSLSAGSLPPGLGINASTGVISGTPTTAITSNFTVKVADSEVPSQTATASLALTIQAASSACAGTPTGHESLLSGNYAFLVQGFQGGGAGTAVSIAASFSVGTAGQVSGGDIDISNAAGYNHYTVTPYSTGTPVSLYTVGLDPTSAGNLGCVMLTTNAGSALTFHFSLGGISGGVASRGRIIEFDDTSGSGTVAAGTMALQSPGAFVLSSLKANYAFGLDGETLGGKPVAEGGSFAVSNTGAITNEVADVNTGGAISALTGTTTGSISGVSSTNGRAAITSSVSGTTLGWAAYIVNANQMYLVSTAAPIGGTALATGSSFSQATLGGNYVVRATGITSCGGAPCSDINLGLLNVNGTVNGPVSAYNAGTGLTQLLVANGTYSVGGTSGRTTFTGVPNTPVGYLVTPAVDGISAFLVGTDAGAHFGVAESQTGVTLPGAPVLYGTTDPRYNTVTTYVGTANVTGGGSLTGTQDNSSQAGSLLSGQAVAATVTLLGNGVGSVGGNSVAVTTGTRLLWFYFGGGVPGVITVAVPQ